MALLNVTYSERLEATGEPQNPSDSQYARGQMKNDSKNGCCCVTTVQQVPHVPENHPRMDQEGGICVGTAESVFKSIDVWKDLKQGFEAEFHLKHRQTGSYTLNCQCKYKFEDFSDENKSLEKYDNHILLVQLC